MDGTLRSRSDARGLQHVPFAEKLPKPQELIASAYDFAGQLLASQRKFAEDVLKTTAPMLTAMVRGAIVVPAISKKTFSICR
jgi:hypothetical protein